MNHPVFFQPADAWVGDLIPFEHDGEFWLFYLHEVRSDPKPGTAWNLVTTKDLIQFQDQGVSLPHGTDADLDFNAYTGSILVDESGVHHLFYTGQNPNNLGMDGLPLQLVMHATSTDGMRTWVKHPELTFGAPAGYESGDWRDPFVFRDEAAGQWRMLIAARHSEGPERRRGVVAQCTSKDLMTWEYTDPFWDPRRYITHECPDVFSWGDWWYMVYSEFSETFTTRYRMAKSPDGPGPFRLGTPSTDVPSTLQKPRNGTAGGSSSAGSPAKKEIPTTALAVGGHHGSPGGPAELRRNLGLRLRRRTSGQLLG
jgi:beta-fructofuranosidase